MSLTGMKPSMPVVQLHSEMSEVGALEVVKDELYHDGLEIIKNWLGPCSLKQPHIVIKVLKAVGELWSRFYHTMWLFGAFAANHIGYIYAVLTVIAIVEGF
jgi:hypothetical protein